MLQFALVSGRLFFAISEDFNVDYLAKSSPMSIHVFGLICIQLQIFCSGDRKMLENRMYSKSLIRIFYKLFQITWKVLNGLRSVS